MNTIDYTQVPYNFALCLHTQCPMASTCLRRLVWDTVVQEFMLADSSGLPY